MHSLLSSFGLALLTILGVVTVLALVLVVMIELRSLVRLTGQFGTDPDDEPRFFADVDHPNTRRL